MGILTPRNHYKPLDLPWAYDLWKQHRGSDWFVHEIPMHEDVRDWADKLSPSEKSLLTHLLRFFTQADVDVAAGYNKRFLPYFSHKPELAMMMNDFAAREGTHVDAYAVLLETLGFPEETYEQFKDYKEMKDKHDYVNQFSMDDPVQALKSLAVYSAFTEGMQLFASFVVLLNFSRFNKMKGMGTVVAWSIRDESMHVDGMTHLFREFYREQLKENYPDINRYENFSKVEGAVSDIARHMVELEDNFIDLIFSDTDAVEGLTPQEVKDYIRFISNKRWTQLGFAGSLFPDNTTNNLPWVDWMINGEEHSNFFESRPTFYAKAQSEGSMDDIQWTA